MADSKSISELTIAEQTTANDLFETALANGQLGYLSRKVTLAELANFIVNSNQYSSALNTNSKVITGAINEVLSLASGGTELTATLTAGQTSVTFNNVAILITSTFDFYTDTWGVNPTAVTVSTGTLVLTFEAQVSDVSVKVVVK